LTRIQSNPALAQAAKDYYRERPADWIEHWAVTFDPRNAGTPLPTKMPFILFKRQRELVSFLHALLVTEESGLIEKCRDMGATWLCAAFSVWLWLYYPGATIGWGSRKEQLVDRIGVPDSIFEKMRIIIKALPRELLPVGFNPVTHATYMRIINPEIESTIIGETGDNIGRGGRSLIYFKDESAHYEHPEAIEAALGDNTRVQIDISSVHGLGNVFHRKREAGVDWVVGEPVARGRTNVFVMDWRDHPMKTQAWYDARRAKWREDGLLHIFAQEVDRDYASAVEGVVIPAEWVRAAVDADVTLGFAEAGGWAAALDVADEGGDTNALAKRKGCKLKSCEEWGERDTGVTARRAVDGCRGLGPIDLQYDCIGVGAGIKAETNRLIDDGVMPKNIRLVPWSAGAGVIDPDKPVIPEDPDSPLNKDFYYNLKAQGWWMLRRRFELTWRAVRSRAPDATEDERKFTWEYDDLIVLPGNLPNIRKIEKELSQPTYGQGSKLKMVINKTPEGTRSPNLADAIVMAFWPADQKPVMVISDAAISQARRMLRRRPPF
jgi:hypothetical protein